MRDHQATEKQKGRPPVTFHALASGHAPLLSPVDWQRGRISGRLPRVDPNQCTLTLEAAVPARTIVLADRAYTCDVAISAVASDGGLVTELLAELAPRLPTPPEWRGEHARPDAELAPLLNADHSRVALVLHQQLWHHDARTLCDAAVLRSRVLARRGSVCVLALDDSPVASWLARAPRYALAESGRAGAVDFVVGIVAAAGGTVKPQPHRRDEPVARWPEPPTPFLAQPRAHSALRHELDGMVAVLKREIEHARAAQPDRPFELHVLPHRVIARLDDVAISFSWVTGRVATVSDGRLLVIAWRGVAGGVRGVAALKSAAPIHERVYVADGTKPEVWCWRAEDLARQPYATAHLVADWLGRACIARSG